MELHVPRRRVHVPEPTRECICLMIVYRFRVQKFNVTGESLREL